MEVITKEDAPNDRLRVSEDSSVQFDHESGVLAIRGKSENLIAMYAPGAWVRVTTEGAKAATG